MAAGDAERQGLRRRVVKEVLLYPQQSGTLHIEQSSMTVVAQIVVQSRSHSQSLFDDFFGGQSVQEVRKNLSAAPVPVTVRDFPGRRAGLFQRRGRQVPTQRRLDKQTVTANASDTYLLKLSGSGNLPLIQAPKPELPPRSSPTATGSRPRASAIMPRAYPATNNSSFLLFPGRRAIIRFLRSSSVISIPMRPSTSR